MSTKAYGVRVSRSGRFPTDDAVSVDYAFPRSAAGDRHPLRIRSSNFVRGGLPAEFGAVRDVVKRRRQQGGTRKGRVFYVLQGQQPLVVMAYHVPAKGPLEVIAVGADRGLERADAARLQAHLLSCLEEAALALGRTGSLAWVASTDNTAEVAKEVHGFKASKRPNTVTARHYLTRTIRVGKKP